MAAIVSENAATLEGRTDGGGRASQLICAGKRKYGEPHRKAVVPERSHAILYLAILYLGEARTRLPELSLLFGAEVEQRTRVIGEISRVEDLNAGIMVASERRLIARAASLYGIVKIIEPNTKVIDLHGIDLGAGR